MRSRVGVLVVGMVVAFGAAMAGATADAASPKAPRLRAFDGCGSFVAYMKAHALPLVGRPLPATGIAVGAQPGAARDKVTGAPASQDPAFSGTNVQESGVDEPDTVKTDGKFLYIASGGAVSALDVRSGRPRLVGTLRLDTAGVHELLLHGDRLLVLSRGGAVPLPGPATGIRSPVPIPIRSTLAEIDVGDPARLRLVRTMELDGSYVTARLVGGVVRIVISTATITEFPLVPPDRATPGSGANASERNRKIVRSAPASGWLPDYAMRNARGKVTDRGSLVGCKDVLRPPVFSGLGLTTVVTLDLARGLEPVDSDAVAADARVVYASSKSLYVATDQMLGLPVRGVPTHGGTTIHRFDISSPAQTDYRASGRVPGVLLDQWSLSERDGVLRVASTTLAVGAGGAGAQSETVVTTLTERDGKLVQLGRVGGLGKGERVYAVRFVGDVGYVVTFRQVDPLYTLDLSAPSRPAVRGELKIRGYSAYLHPLGDGLLLGIGQDATDDGRTVGLQASLFDVSNLAQPKRLDAFMLAKSASQAERDHHAFLWWPRTRLAVIPVESYVDRPFLGVLGLHVRRTGISEAGRIVHQGRAGFEPVGSPGTPISRSLVVGDTLYTVSVAGVKASALGTFADRGFVPLPSIEATGSQPKPKLPPPPPPSR